MKTNARRLLAGSIMVAMTAMALTGCDVARAGARCRPNGAWAWDSTFVLHCQNGRWVRTITIAHYLQLLARNAPTTTTIPVSPTTQKPPPPTTTTSTTTSTTSTTTSTTSTSTSTTTTTEKAADYVSLDHVTTYTGSVPDWTDPVPGDWAPASDDFRIVALGVDDCANDGDVAPQFAASVDDTGALQLQLILRWNEDPMGDGPQGQWQCAMAPLITLALYSSTDPDATVLGYADVDFASDLVTQV